MLQPKLRRVLASAALLSTLSLLPAHAAAPRAPRSQRPARSESNVAVRLVAPVWDLVIDLLSKASVRIDPDGNRLAVVRADSDGNGPAGSPSANP